MMVTIVRAPVRLSLRTAKILSVIGPVGLILAIFAGAMFLGPDGRVQKVFLVLRLVFMLVLLPLIFDGRSQSTIVPEKFDALFDERERSQRDRAFRNSHMIVVGSVILASMYVQIAMGWGFWLPDLRGAVDIGMCYGLVVLGLPGMILLWREPDVSNED
jgi:hypothetical protein